MDQSFLLYITLIVAGLFLIGVEIFVPGGIIGSIGALSLIAAMLVGFKAFGPSGGLLSAFVIILLAGVGIALWIKFFPRTAMGRHLTLSRDSRNFKAASPELKDLIGKEGIAHSALHPGGIATIEGHRVDVIAEGNWIEGGRRVRVLNVEGSRVVVREESEPGSTA
ncbi:MAG: hypothetical protein KKC51_12120 [Verrucomicrobia bacterium]|nr:hypothetical protein [Verrucomicrobiota bacterium]